MVREKEMRAGRRKADADAPKFSHDEIRFAQKSLRLRAFLTLSYPPFYLNHSRTLMPPMMPCRFLPLQSKITERGVALARRSYRAPQITTHPPIPQSRPVTTAS